MLKTFFTLPRASLADTFNRVFAAWQSEEMEKGFVLGYPIAKADGGRSSFPSMQGAVRYLCSRQKGHRALVSAWANSNTWSWPAQGGREVQRDHSHSETIGGVS